MNDLLKIFEIEKSCEYRGEMYRVRDNGSIYRCSKHNKRKRPMDENWTFGKPDTKRGYMNFSNETVHRIVATAFHGKQPSKKHIVDHIDTNKKNNRPENLRWITRLENILLNPITLSRIVFKYGSIDDFLSNPSKPIAGELEQNFEWMRTVTKEESESARENLKNWARRGQITEGGQLGEWIFNQNIKQEQEKPEVNYILSKTPNASQRLIFYNDKPNDFPCTPQSVKGNPLNDYYENLREGSVFFRNHNGEYVVVKSGFSKDKSSVYILTRADYVYRENKEGGFRPTPISELQEAISHLNLPHALTEVTYEDDLFLHSKVESGFHPREELEEIFAKYTKDEILNEN